jgi:hypothetical protein
MWPTAALFGLGLLLFPFTALAPSSRNLTALLPEFCGLLGSLYRHCWDEVLLVATLTGLHRRRDGRGS